VVIRIIVVFLVIFLCGCQTQDKEGEYHYIDQGESVPSLPPNAQPDITYEVEHTRVEDIENPLDFYSVKIFENSNDSIKLSKYVSKKDKFYLLSLTYVGNNYRFMSGAVVIENDGFISEYNDGRPYQGNLSDGAVTEIVTIRLGNFTVNDLRSAVNLQIQFQFELPIVITPEGIENIKRFVTEMDGDFNPFLSDLS
jgi:hypothetical protein